jgi:Tfp pilus assembly protein PilF
MEILPEFSIDPAPRPPVDQPTVLGAGRLLPCVFGVALFWVAGLGCAGGVSPKDAERSMRQYELAVGLRGEGNAPGAYQALYKALEVDPDNARAHLLLAHMFLLDRDDNPALNDAKAEEHFAEVLEIQASDSRKKPEQSLVSEAHNGLGVLRIHQERYQEAVVSLLEAVSDLFNREAYMAWGNLGWAYYHLGKSDKAADALLRAVKLHPRFCVGYFRLGQAYVKLADHEKAEQAFTSAVSADERCSSFQDAFHRRGEARMNLGLREEARADFERCVEIASGSDAGKSCRRYLEATY